jgi:hypothetical protein
MVNLKEALTFFGDLSTPKSQDFPLQKLCDLASLRRYVSIWVFAPQEYSQPFQPLF